jgi:hypothetical protein
MNRRKFIVGLIAAHFVTLFGKLAKAEKPPMRLRMGRSYYGKTIPIVLGDTRCLWKHEADGRSFPYLPIPDDKTLADCQKRYAD